MKLRSFITFFLLFISLNLFAQIVSVSPDTFRRGELIDIEITTENINFQQGTNLISFKQDRSELSIYNNIEVQPPNSIKVKQVFNNQYPLGSYDLLIKTFSGNQVVAEKSNAVFVQPDLTVASLDSISQTSAKQGESIVLTIYGSNTNFHKKGLENIVYMSNSVQGIQPSSVTVVDSLTLQASFNFTFRQRPGIFSVTFSNLYDGVQSKDDIFELLAAENYPAITSVTPDTVKQGQILDVKISAENINFQQGTNVITLTKEDNRIYLSSITALSSDSLRGVLSVRKNEPVGNYNLSVWNSSFDVTMLADQTIIKENAFYLKSATVGVNSVPLRQEELIVYPNPADNLLNLTEHAEFIEIYDTNGRRLARADFTESINISSLREGLYLLKAKVDGDIFSRKIIIQ